MMENITVSGFEDNDIHNASSDSRRRINLVYVLLKTWLSFVSFFTFIKTILYYIMY